MSSGSFFFAGYLEKDDTEVIPPLGSAETDVFRSVAGSTRFNASAVSPPAAMPDSRKRFVGTGKRGQPIGLRGGTEAHRERQRHDQRLALAHAYPAARHAGDLDHAVILCVSRARVCRRLRLRI